MSSHLPPLPLPRTLALPARDLLRGVRHAVSRRHGPFAPLLSALEPARAAEGEAGACTPRSSLDGQDRQALADAAALAPPDVLAAGGRAAALAALAFRGLRIVLRRLGRADLMISETVLVYAVREARRASLAAAEERAAAIAASILRHHAIAFAPGTGFALRSDDVEDARLAISAVMLWLLAERAPRIAEEFDLLSLCLDVALVEREAVREAGDDHARVAELLRSLSRLI